MATTQSIGIRCWPSVGLIIAADPQRAPDTRPWPGGHQLFTTDPGKSKVSDSKHILSLVTFSGAAPPMLAQSEESKRLSCVFSSAPLKKKNTVLNFTFCDLTSHFPLTNK